MYKLYYIRIMRIATVPSENITRTSLDILLYYRNY